MRPVVHGLETEFGSQIDFIYLNVDEPGVQEAQRAFGHRFQPQYVLLNAEGELVQQWLGLVRKATFREALASLAEAP